MVDVTIILLEAADKIADTKTIDVLHEHIMHHRIAQNDWFAYLDSCSSCLAVSSIAFTKSAMSSALYSHCRHGSMNYKKNHGRKNMLQGTKHTGASQSIAIPPPRTITNITNTTNTDLVITRTMLLRPTLQTQQTLI